jgi:serine/threonine-protein kinase
MICPLCHRSYGDATAAFCGEDGTLLVDAPPIKRATPLPGGEAGTVLGGRYEIRGLIGRGGLARVYLAKDAVTGHEVAVKVLDSSKVQSRSMRDRFLREVEIAARIGHPNIARILDAGERHDRAPYIVLEYLAGESVGELVSREGRLGVEFALELAKRAASALVAAHAEGVIHRDVKPDNLFLVDDGSVLKILDFGMAKLQEGAFTAVGTAIGTLPYMAPEQSMGDRVDGRTDVYGLGITLFRMITGRLPFEADDDATVVAHHLYTPMPHPSALQAGLDPRIDRLILAATRKLPDNRYSSMRAMLEDIGRILGDRAGDVEAPEVRTLPDLYEPENPISRSVSRHLRALVGR